MNNMEQAKRENKIRRLNKVSVGMSGILLLFIILEQKIDLSSKNDNLIPTIYFVFILIFVSLRLTSLYNKHKVKTLHRFS